MSAHMDHLVAEFEKFRARQRQAEARFAGVADMREQIEQVECVATSPERTVTVTAGAGGMVTDVQLTLGAMRLDPAELSATIMTTLREAVAGAVRQQAGIVEEVFGDAFGVNLSEQVRQAQAEAFGTPADDHASQHEASPTSRHAVPPDDEEFDQGSIYGRR
jgi:DNA-binding protein YbaB